MQNILAQLPSQSDPQNNGETSNEDVEKCSISNVCFFAFTLFTPMFMPPKEAEADGIGDIIESVAKHVTIEGIKGVYGYFKKKVADHKSGPDHPGTHPTEETTQCGGSDCNAQVSSSSHHVKLCTKCKVLYYTCESHTCDNNSSTNSSSSGYYDYSWW